MTAGPRASASGERHIIARGIEADGRDALRLGSREPGAALAARAPKKSQQIKFRDSVSARQKFDLTLRSRRCESQPCVIRRNEWRPKTIRHSGVISMLMTNERRPAIRTVRGWAIDVLQYAGAIRECEKHGWMQDRADPHAWERAIDIAREDPPAGISPDAAAAEVRDVLNSIGDTCPECPPD